MPADNATGFDRRRSLAVGRGRAVAILDRLFEACDMDDLLDYLELVEGTRPNRKVLSRVLNKMIRRRQVYVIAVQLGSFVGPPRKVYCRTKLYAPNHDNAVTKVKRALGWPEGERYFEIEPVNGKTPDWVTYHPKRRLWEIDMGTEGFEEIHKKAEAFKTQDRAVLWVCPTEARRRWLVEKTKAIHDKSFYALYADLLADPFGAVWLTAGGERKVLSFVAKEVGHDPA